MIRLSFCLASVPLLALSLAACSSVPAAGVNPDEPQFPYFGEVRPKSEIKDASLVDAPPPPPPIWRVEDTGTRHLVSGALCPGDIGAFTLLKENSYPGLPRGYDVACSYEGPSDARMKLHITHFGRTVSLDAHLKGVDGAIIDAYSVIGRKAPPQNAIGDEIAVRRSGFRLRPSEEDEPQAYIVTWLEDIAGWHVKLRATFNEQNREDVGLAAGKLYDTVRTGMREREQLLATQLP